MHIFPYYEAEILDHQVVAVKNTLGDRSVIFARIFKHGWFGGSPTIYACDYYTRRGRKEKWVKNDFVGNRKVICNRFISLSTHKDLSIQICLALGRALSQVDAKRYEKGFNKGLDELKEEYFKLKEKEEAMAIKTKMVEKK